MMFSFINSKIWSRRNLVMTVLLVLLIFTLSFSYSHAASDTCALHVKFLGCFDTVVGGLLGFAVSLFSWILTVANLAVAFAIKISIIDFKNYYNDARGAWSVILGLANIVFVFILLYIAIGTILQLSSVSTRRMLVGVITAALLINFSFFFTGVMIDASNVVTNGLYRNLPSEGPVQISIGIPPVSTGTITTVPVPDITTSLTKALKIETLLAESAARDADFGFFAAVAQSFGTILLILAASMALFTVAILFIIRTVVLLFLVILSPLAFLGWVIPPLQSQAKKWWDMLLNQLIFAPAFMLVFSLPLFIAENRTDLPGGVAATIVFNIILIGLVIGSVIVAKQAGAVGAGFATKWGGRLTGLGASAVGLGFRGVGAGLGYGAKRYDDKYRDGEGAKRLGALRKSLDTFKDSSVVKGVRQSNFGQRFKESFGGGELKSPLLSTTDAIAEGTGIPILGTTKQQKRDIEKEEAAAAKAKKEKESAISLEKAKRVLSNSGADTAAIREAVGDLTTSQQVSLGTKHYENAKYLEAVGPGAVKAILRNRDTTPNMRRKIGRTVEDHLEENSESPLKDLQNDPLYDPGEDIDKLIKETSPDTGVPAGQMRGERVRPKINYTQKFKK